MGIDSEYQGGTYEQVQMMRERREAAERRAGKVFLICGHCGNQAPDVVCHAAHAGDEHYPQGDFCGNRKECQERIDAKKEAR